MEAELQFRSGHVPKKQVLKCQVFHGENDEEPRCFFLVSGVPYLRNIHLVVLSVVSIVSDLV